MRRLPSPTRMWKVFINTLQSKLHRLNRSKAIKKPPKGPLSKTRKRVSWLAFSTKSRPRKLIFQFKPSQKLRYCKPQCLQRRSSPVYIDQLFLEPVLVAKEHAPQSSKQTATKERKDHVPQSSKETARREGEADKRIISLSPQKRYIIDEQDDMPETSNQQENANETMNTADDMWESFLLASPQMHGINERAEVFIARFRAEMHLQEMLDRQ